MITGFFFFALAVIFAIALRMVVHVTDGKIAMLRAECEWWSDQASENAKLAVFRIEDLIDLTTIDPVLRQ